MKYNDIDFEVFEMDHYDYGDIVLVSQCASGAENMQGRIVYRDSKKVGVLIYKPDMPMTPLNALYTEYFDGVDVNTKLTLVRHGD